MINITLITYKKKKKKRALAQLALPPLASAKWRVKSWAQDPLDACVNNKKFSTNITDIFRF